MKDAFLTCAYPCASVSSYLIVDCLMIEQKEKLSEVEQQLKKAEAAQRRRIQSEKAAREAEVCHNFIILLTFRYAWLNKLFIYATLNSFQLF